MLADLEPTTTRRTDDGGRGERRAEAVRSQVHWNAVSLRRDPPAGERAGRSDRA